MFFLQKYVRFYVDYGKISIFSPLKDLFMFIEVFETDFNYFRRMTFNHIFYTKLWSKIVKYNDCLNRKLKKIIFLSIDKKDSWIAMNWFTFMQFLCLLNFTFMRKECCKKSYSVIYIVTCSKNLRRIQKKSVTIKIKIDLILSSKKFLKLRSEPQVLIF